MKKLSLAVCAAAVVFAASSPASAYFQVIRWTSGHCETWNYDLPTRPMLADYKVLTKPIPTFEGALAAKADLLRKGACWF